MCAIGSYGRARVHCRVLRCNVQHEHMTHSHFMLLLLVVEYEAYGRRSPMGSQSFLVAFLKVMAATWRIATSRLSSIATLSKFTSCPGTCWNCKICTNSFVLHQRMWSADTQAFSATCMVVSNARQYSQPPQCVRSTLMQPFLADACDSDNSFQH